MNFLHFENTYEFLKIYIKFYKILYTKKKPFPNKILFSFYLRYNFS